MYIRPAQQHDADTIIRWRREAAAWLAEHGSDQWSEAGLPNDKFADRVAQSIAAGETWMAADDDGAAVATIALDQWSDPGLWDEEQLAHSLVLHRMIIDRNAAGRGIGEVLLRHAEHTAAALGRRWLLLDAWSTNSDLHAYYRLRGFEYVRTVPGFASGALFQRTVSEVADELPTALEQEFRGQQERKGATERPNESHVDHAALAEELRATSQQYREAARHVTSPLLLTALDAAARQASACARAEDQLVPTGRVWSP